MTKQATCQAAACWDFYHSSANTVNIQHNFVEPSISGSIGHHSKKKRAE